MAELTAVNAWMLRSSAWAKILAKAHSCVHFLNCTSLVCVLATYAVQHTYHLATDGISDCTHALTSSASMHSLYDRVPSPMHDMLGNLKHCSYGLITRILNCLGNLLVACRVVAWAGLGLCETRGNSVDRR